MQKTMSQIMKKLTDDPFWFDEEEMLEAIEQYGQPLLDFLLNLVVVQDSGEILLNRIVIGFLMTFYKDTRQTVLTKIRKSLPNLRFGGYEWGFNDAIYSIYATLGGEILLRWLDGFKDFYAITLSKSDMPDMPPIETIQRAISDCKDNENPNLQEIIKSVKKKINDFFNSFGLP
ncbi:MAG: hypothetical protein EU529_04655 [Promethearchaeota archaeon]|nr:MAG: hypothetical protein EU529_04655 [Candidatus Lokiarchaeota archaeon]